MRISDWSSDVCSSDLAGFSGVAHTRWATHGIPSEDNAHPHASQGVCVVHNGIIENHAALRAQLQQAGFVFESQTDTEVIALLIVHLQDDGRPLLAAVPAAFAQLDGAYDIVVLRERDPGTPIGAPHVLPWVPGLGVG